LSDIDHRRRRGLVDAIDGKVQRVLKAGIAAGAMPEDTQVIAVEQGKAFGEV